MSWQARVIDRGTNAELWLTVCGPDLRTAEANALAKAAFQLQANPAELDAVSVHQLPTRRNEQP